jgi:tetratricopeptide (TPR) repeat protein
LRNIRERAAGVATNRFQRRYPVAAEECYQLIIDKDSDGELVEQAKQRLEETRRLAKELLAEAKQLVGVARYARSRDPVAAEKHLQRAKRLLQTVVDKDPEGELAEEVDKLEKKIKSQLGELTNDKDERMAFGLLQGAKVLLGRNKAAAKRRLERILADYPKSNAAPGAREALRLLDDGKVEEARKRLEEIIEEHFKPPEAVQRR